MNMEFLRYRRGIALRLFGIIALVLLVCAGVTYADTLESEIISFSPGTTISSSQVNGNFQSLVSAMPRVGIAPGSTGDITLTYVPQNIKSITVTPPMDGVLMFIASAALRLDSGANPGPAGAATAKLCLSQNWATCGSSDNSRVVNLAAPTYPLATSVNMPLTHIALQPCNANIPVTYYLSALQLEPSAGLCVVEGADLIAIFLPGLLPQ
jgi:hypothetical protein